MGNVQFPKRSNQNYDASGQLSSHHKLQLSAALDMGYCTPICKDQERIVRHDSGIMGTGGL